MLAALLLACAASGADILTVPEASRQAIVVETERTQAAGDLQAKLGAILAHLEAMEAELSAGAPDAPPLEPLPAVADSE